MAAAVTARTSEGQGRGRERIVPVEPIRDVPAMATVDRQGRHRPAGRLGPQAWLALAFRQPIPRALTDGGRTSDQVSEQVTYGRS